jgi:hypothetical protein
MQAFVKAYIYYLINNFVHSLRKLPKKTACIRVAHVGHTAASRDADRRACAAL